MPMFSVQTILVMEETGSLMIIFAGEFGVGVIVGVGGAVCVGTGVIVGFGIALGEGIRENKKYQSI